VNNYKNKNNNNNNNNQRQQLMQYFMDGLAFVYRVL